MHLLSSEEMVYETLTQITLRRSKQHLPPPWGEMGGRKARSYPQILVKNLNSQVLSSFTRAAFWPDNVVTSSSPGKPRPDNKVRTPLMFS